MVENNKEKLSLIRKIADILEEYNLSEIFYKFNDEKNKKISINLKKEKTSSDKKVHSFNYPLVSENKEIQENKTVLNEDNGGTIIKSPMVGTIYLSPEPNSDPFVNEGDKIKEGETILIIEAMKTMNQIQATKSGVISKIFVENGSPIDYGASLVEIKWKKNLKKS